MPADVTDKVSAADVKAFDRDGAICIRGIIDQHWIDRMREATARVLARAESGPPSFRTMLYMWKTDTDFRDFAIDSPLVPIAAAILQTQNLRLFADQLLVKEPGSSEKTPWHQDLPYWPIRGNQLCTIWVALDNVTLESGAVEYIRGSHRWNKWYKPESFSASQQLVSPDWETVPDFDAHRAEYDFLQWDVEPGDCIIHHPLVVHGAGGNAHTDRQRRAIAPRYAGDDVRWDPPEGVPLRRDPGLERGGPLDSPDFPLIVKHEGEQTVNSKSQA